MMFMFFSWGLTTAQNSIHTTSDLDRSRLTDTRSAENDWIGADTDPEYRIDASLLVNSENWSLSVNVYFKINEYVFFYKDALN